MRTSICMVAIVVLTVAAGACSSGSSALEITYPQEHGAIPFTATGVAVDEGVVCGAGIMDIDRLESMAGETITDAEWGAIFDTAMEEGGVAEMYVFHDFECDDGSGALLMKFHNRFDFSTFEFEGQQDVGTWEVAEGTGDYESLSGSGDVTLDWDNEQAVWVGEVETG